MDSRSALTELKNFQGSRKGAGDYYSQYQKELGVGDAQARTNDIRGLIRNTETALKGVNQSVAGRTRGNLVNEAQRARLEGIERAPIAEELGTLQGSFADEQQNYRDLLGQATTRAGQAYQTDADRLAALESNYNKIFQAEQAAAEEARWRQQFEEDRRQFNENYGLQKAQSDALKAQIANLSRVPDYTTPQQSQAQSTPQIPSAPRLSAPAILSPDNIRDAARGGYFTDFGKNISQGFNNVAKYGPLALFGKGTIW